MKVNFQGYNLYELFDHFNLEIEEPDIHNDRKVQKCLEDFLSYHIDVLYSSKDTISSEEVAQDCRDYLEKFIDNLELLDEEYSIDNTMMFSSLEEIKDDITFLEYFILLLPKMSIEEEM